MVSFYRRFLPSIARMLQPLTDALHGGRKGADKLEWSADMDAAFAGAQQHIWLVPRWGWSCQWLWTPRRRT
jgi:hypothetical protein